MHSTNLSVETPEKIVDKYYVPSGYEVSGMGYDRYIIIDSIRATMERTRDEFGGRRKVHPLRAFDFSVEMNLDCGISTYSLVSDSYEFAVHAAVEELAQLGMNQENLPSRALKAWPQAERICAIGLHRAVLLNDSESMLFPEINPMEADPLDLVRIPVLKRVEKSFQDHLPLFRVFMNHRTASLVKQTEIID